MRADSGRKLVPLLGVAANGDAQKVGALPQQPFYADEQPFGAAPEKRLSVHFPPPRPWTTPTLALGAACVGPVHGGSRREPFGSDTQRLQCGHTCGTLRRVLRPSIQGGTK